MKYHEYAALFPMMEKAEFDELKADIKANGLLQPIYLFEGEILDGRNRHKACVELGIKPKFEEYKGETPLEFVISLNLQRRHLTESQRAAISLDALPMFEKEAKKRQGERKDLTSVKKLPEVQRASEQVAKLFRTNRSYVSQAKKLKETNPQMLEDVKSGKKNFSEITKEQRKEKIAKQIEEIKKLEPEKALKGVFDVIVVDPPWKFQGEYDPNGRACVPDYPQMSYEEIGNIKLPSADNCVLWLWTTNTDLRMAYEIVEKWGFSYKVLLTWGKDRAGIGHWLRGQTEHVLLATKGKPPFTGKDYTTLLLAPRGKHSEKPDKFYELVDKTCHGRKLDYFARKKREGWVVYGDEVEK